MIYFNFSKIIKVTFFYCLPLYTSVITVIITYD